MIDGVYNETRKLYILTTNKLNLDENLLGRPGRIRYIKQFGNLTPKAIADYIADNLLDKSKTTQILDAVDSLEISTIDILKSIVDEVNIHGEIEENSLLNIPKASYRISVIRFDDVEKSRFNELKSFILSQLAQNETVGQWLNKPWVDSEGEHRTNISQIDNIFDADCYSTQIASVLPVLTKSQNTRIGTIIEQPDKHGFFTVREPWENEETLCCIISYSDAPSLYGGGLQQLYG